MLTEIHDVTVRFYFVKISYWGETLLNDERKKIQSFSQSKWKDMNKWGSEEASGMGSVELMGSHSCATNGADLGA